ncbi:hypothetical protein BDW74DRAFT_170037 [Aspergillus multicolor]|uniref:putative mitochondrial inner membrane protease subunit 1 n=1 Tax=Aspergillus multicolor TaxID=41759 RepID=UPI003CCDED22
MPKPDLLRLFALHSSTIFSPRTLYYSAGTFCASLLFWDNVLMWQGAGGPSMYPTFEMRGDVLLISKLHKHGRGIGVGDVVRFYHPSFVGVHACKRVIGMPGDFVCRDEALDDGVGGNGEMIRVPEGHVFVAGDNLPWSRDSRTFGPLPMGLINGKVIGRIWPLSRFKWVDNTLKPAETA